MEKVFFTGGTGFFGLAILRYLQKNEYYNNYKFYLFTRNIDKFKSRCPKSRDLQNITLIEGDILLSTTFPVNIFDYVIHAATDSTEGLKMDYINRSTQIVEGTRNVLEWCKAGNVKKLLFVSSGGVYGTINKPVHESDNICPTMSNVDNTYSISKLFAEHLCFLYGKTYNFSVSVARCFSFIGRDLPRNAHFAAGNFLRDIENNRPININGDGSPIRSFMDQEDLAHWLLTILLNGADNEIYNVGSDEEISIKNFAELIKKTLHSNLPINLQYQSVYGQALGRSYYVPNIDKAKSDLGLYLNFTLKDSILNIFKLENGHND